MPSEFLPTRPIRYTMDCLATGIDTRDVFYWIVLYIEVNLMPVSITVYSPGMFAPDSNKLVDNIIFIIPGYSALKSV